MPSLVAGRLMVKRLKISSDAPVPVSGEAQHIMKYCWMWHQTCQTTTTKPKLTLRMIEQTSRRQKYFTGHSVWWRAIFHQTESKFAGPKSLSGILTNKSEISLVATFLALANTIILRHAVSSLKKLLARYVSLLLLWQKNLWDVFHFSVVLHSWDPSFRATSFKHVLARIQKQLKYHGK